MEDGLDTLRKALEAETADVDNLFDDSDCWQILIELIRFMDSVSVLVPHAANLSEKQKSELFELYDFGWNLLFNKLYARLHLQPSTGLFASTDETFDWLNETITRCGNLGLAKQILEYHKAGIMRVKPVHDRAFSFHNEGSSLEHFETRSFEFLQDIAFKAIADKYEKHKESYPAIQKVISNTAMTPLGVFISYATTPEVDDYFARVGYFHLFSHMCYDDFDEADLFGGIPYKLFLDVLQDVMGIAYKHIDYCMVAKERNPNANMGTLLSYIWNEKKTIEDFANYFSVSTETMTTVFSCLTLTKDNYQLHTGEGRTLAPYVRISESQLIRSVSGCLSGQHFLKRELKRAFTKDYFNAVNNREKRFREELYGVFFSAERFVTIKKEIVINLNGFKTDIDAAVFDTKTKTLGLFQLKWQDMYGHSMKERFSRMSNLYPKAEEWIQKVTVWLESSTKKSILAALQLNPSEDLGEICLFVISRNMAHFTGKEIDQRAAWGSWHQLMYAESKYKMLFDDPIRELYAKLKVDDPRLNFLGEEIPERATLTIKVGDIELSYETTSAPLSES